MAVPIKENIAVNIMAAVNTVTVASGFNQDLTAVRPMRNDFKDVMPKDNIVLIKQLDPINPEKQPEGPFVEWDQPYAIMAIVLDGDDVVTTIDTRLNQVEADIQKKLMEDPYRNNNAIDTTILPSYEFDDEKGFTGIAVIIEVKYRTKIEDPYTKA